VFRRLCTATASCEHRMHRVAEGHLPGLGESPVSPRPARGVGRVPGLAGGQDNPLENGLSAAHIRRMAREKYESLLRCPICERTGLADMSDDKSSRIGDYDTRIEAVTQGFEIKGKDVICSGCQVSAL
jgi:hypothetical protein